MRGTQPRIQFQFNLYPTRSHALPLLQPVTPAPFAYLTGDFSDVSHSSSRFPYHSKSNRCGQFCCRAWHLGTWEEFIRRAHVTVEKEKVICVIKFVDCKIGWCRHGVKLHRDTVLPVDVVLVPADRISLSCGVNLGEVLRFCLRLKLESEGHDLVLLYPQPGTMIL